jgi:hypothetical protein
MVTQQLDHLVLNLTKPGIRGLVRDAAMVRPVPRCGRYAEIIRPASPSSDPAVGAVLYGTDDAREGIAAFVAKPSRASAGTDEVGGPPWLRA